MRYAHIIEQLYTKPWLITAGSHKAIRDLITNRLKNTHIQRDGEGPCGEQVELESMAIEEGIAHIPISGIIGTRLTGFEKGSGAVDTNDIHRELLEAEDNPEVDAILFDIDSPGGMVTGTPELADRIRSIQKPIFAFTASGAQSAAYWIASATDGIFTTRSAEVGSIGVYQPFFDESVAYEQAGVKVDIIKAGRLKAAGFPGTSLSDAQRAQKQSEVDSIHEDFKTAVREKRSVNSDDMQGQSFMAEKALSRGLIDEIVIDKSAAVRQIQNTTMKISEILGMADTEKTAAIEKTKTLLAENTALRAQLESANLDVSSAQGETQKVADASKTVIETSVTNVIDEANKQINVIKESAEKQISEMKKTVEETLASVDKQAGRKSTAALASVGLESSVTEPSTESDSGSLRTQLDAIQDPNTRTAFYRKNKMAIVKESKMRQV
jgi:signal peptide peptidase SppA